MLSIYCILHPTVGTGGPTVNVMDKVPAQIELRFQVKVFMNISLTDSNGLLTG
jgi:hypothetical protein